MTALLLALALQIPQPDLIANPKLPINKYVLPLVGGQQEIVMGLHPLTTQFYGFYSEHAEAYSAKGNMRFDNPQYMVQDRVGSMDWSVASYPRNGKPATLLQTNGLFKQTLPISQHRHLEFANRLKVSYWVSPQGTLLEIDALLRVSSGNWSMQAIFNKDSYDLTLNDPSYGERKSTLYLGFPLEKLNSMFTPMLQGDKVVLKQKDFYTLDFMTGRPVHYVARIGGRWSGKLFNKDAFRGQWIDLIGNGMNQRIYVSDAGVLMKVEEPNHYFISIGEVAHTG
jgi:hypothetical protein